MLIMKFRIAICTLLLTFVGTTASAGFSSEEGWTGWDGWEDTNWGWDQEQTWNGETCKEECSDGGDCDPTGVPSPTAALMGLGVMGLMLTRRRNKRA